MSHTWQMGPDGSWMPVYNDYEGIQEETNGKPVKQEGYTALGAMIGIALTFFLFIAPLIIILLPFILLAGCLVLL